MVSCLGSLCSFKDGDALGSPLTVSLQVIPDALCPNILTQGVAEKPDGF